MNLWKKLWDGFKFEKTAKASRGLGEFKLAIGLVPSAFLSLYSH